MIHIYYGDGKGKTTAAVGLAARAAGNNMRVMFVQFLKTDSSGERLSLEKLDTVTLTPCPRELKFTFEMDEQEKQQAAIAAERKTQIGSGDRSDRVRTYNFPQNRVTDHRLTGEVRSFNLESIINGNLDPLLDALTAMDQARKLAAGEARE